jgi:hypothetical protein
MTLGLYAIRTVSTPAVIARDIPIAQPRPRMSMAADAAQCNARLRRKWGQTGNEAGVRAESQVCADTPLTRSKALQSRNARLAPRIAALIKHGGPMTIRGVSVALGIPEAHALEAMHHMRQYGMITSPPRGSKMGWSVV